MPSHFTDRLPPVVPNRVEPIPNQTSAPIQLKRSISFSPSSHSPPSNPQATVPSESQQPFHTPEEIRTFEKAAPGRN